MIEIYNEEYNYMEPREIADGIYWIGFSHDNSQLFCSPYIIIDGDEAVLIDSGGRDSFSTVMLKILRIGVNPKQIKRLIYQHYDPDLCGNLPHFESIIDSPDLRIISHKDNNFFLDHYSSQTPKDCFTDLDCEYTFGEGRTLKFIFTPYSHSMGSFMTYDTKTKTLFSSDILGSFDKEWMLYNPLRDSCHSCSPQQLCPEDNSKCRVYSIQRFNQLTMSSAKALRYALDRILELDTEIVAPQHGSIIDSKKDKLTIINYLKSIDDIGIDYFLKDGAK